jgi:two-component system catabolic regulation response regulator CreB
MKANILIIEDEGGIVDNIAYALKTEGFETVWCSTGAEAMAEVQARQIDLIILDVGLPDVNGFELFKQIKKQRSVPVIFLTARADEIDRVLGLELGADDYVTKPFSPRELAARVKAVLRRAGGAAEPSEDRVTDERFPFGHDGHKNLITYFGTPLKLSRYEYRILKIFIQHPGWVYSREQLMELAWEEPDVSLLRTVDAHIKNIRQKLKGIRPDCDPILTHHGSGYALADDW